MTTITREQQKQILIDTANHVISRDNTSPYSENLRELARIALASLEAEPIGAFHIADQQVGGTSDYIKDGEWPIDNGVIEVYAAPPASERKQVRHEHAEWSDDTFGDVGPIGPLKHLSKEALEAAADPSDLLEWADMQFLLWDAQRRMGISDEFITRAMIEKLEINKTRQWPEPKDGEPRLHIKEQPAPVVPEEMNFSTACNFVQINGMAKEDRANLAMRAWNACRAAMLQGKFRDLSQPVDPQVAEYEQIMLQADWVVVPVEPTDEMIAAAMGCDDVVFDSKDPTAFCVQYREIYCAMVDTAPKPEVNSEYN